MARNDPDHDHAAAAATATSAHILDRSVHSTIRVLPPEPEPIPDEDTPLLGNGTTKIDGAGAYEFDGQPWWRVPSVYWLVGPFFLFIVAFGGTIVPKLNLITELVCHRYYADRSVATPNPPVFLAELKKECLQPAVQRRVTSLMMAINLVVGLLGSLAVPLLVKMSNRYGRTRLLALAACGGIAAEITTIVVVKFPAVVDYRWFVLGAVFEGLTGSFTAGMVLGHSYVADCTPPSRRGVAVGFLHACIFTGLALGPVLAGYIGKLTGSMLSVFYVVLGCHIFYGLFLLFVVPESLSESHRQESHSKHAAQRLQALRGGPSSWFAFFKQNNPLALLSALVPRGPGSSPQLRRNILCLAVADTLVMSTAMGVWPVIVLYTEYSFGWRNFETSVMMSAVSTVRVIVLLGIFPVINYFARIRPARRRLAQQQAALGTTPPTPSESNAGADNLDVWTIRIALLFDVVGSLGYALAPTGPAFFVAGAMTAIGGLTSATTQTAVSKQVPARMVGQLLGAIGVLQSLGRVGGPLLFNGLYYAFVTTFPPAVFYFMTVVFLVALTASLLVRPGVFLAHVHDDESTESESDVLSDAYGI